MLRYVVDGDPRRVVRVGAGTKLSGRCSCDFFGNVHKPCRHLAAAMLQAMTISYTVAVDWLMARIHRSVHFLIYSSKYDEIATAINTTVNRGVTVLDGTGWYSQKPVKVISVLVRKPESPLVFSMIHEIDPNALVSIADVSGVFGSGFDKMKVK